MANESTDGRAEIGFRNRGYEAYVRRMEADLRSGLFEDWLPRFRDVAGEALSIRDRLATSWDLDRFREELQKWAAGKDVGFKGMNGAMLINSLVKRTDDREELTRLLVAGLEAPADMASAARKMDALYQHIERIKVRGHPQSTNLVFVLPYFWALQDPARWPVAWPSSREFLESSTGTVFTGTPAERYQDFKAMADQLDTDYDRFTLTTSWWVESEIMDQKRSGPPPTDPIVDMVAEFRRDRGYPSDADRRQIAHRERLRKILERENLATADRATLRKIWASAYGMPGNQSGLNRFLRDADDTEYQRILITIEYVCWGDGEDADRIDRVLDDPDYRIPGLGEAVLLKLLAICHPDRYLCVYPYSGKQGKHGMLKALGLPEPLEEASRGRKQVESNDRLRERLAPFLDDDPWGMMCFLYWYLDHGPAPDHGPVSVSKPKDSLEVAARELLVGLGFLEDIVELLKDKGQVILYGPPGTGKTYLAQRLAEALAPDPEDRSLVQFHPSTSYEDFFEGYRPDTGSDGNIVYELTPGPLALMAERAAEYPHRRQVMVIDEINRANLPRALGELLFLFEYRDRPVSTLYRPHDEFELPESLWFIGTMNTADRSIALVDAALRRRFHFVPFFPDRGPTAGLLERWLEREGQPSWVGELVDMVNKGLTEEIGADLQLGPSHFMKEGYRPEPGPDDLLLRRIWEYNIEPLIEDQLFGNPDRINRFRFAAVVDRYVSSSTPDEGSDVEPPRS